MDIGHSGSIDPRRCDAQRQKNGGASQQMHNDFCTLKECMVEKNVVSLARFDARMGSVALLISRREWTSKSSKGMTAVTVHGRERKGGANA